MILSADIVGLVGIFLAIGGQYAILFQIYRMMNDFRIEIATCPYHRTSHRPLEVVNDE